MSWRDHLPAVRGRLLRDEALAPFTWFRVGGPAELIFLPEDEDDLAAFLKGLDPGVPVTPLGVGSNTLVRDGGVEGVVIRLGRGFAKVEPPVFSRIGWVVSRREVISAIRASMAAGSSGRPSNRAPVKNSGCSAARADLR